MFDEKEILIKTCKTYIEHMYSKMWYRSASQFEKHFIAKDNILIVYKPFKAQLQGMYIYF